jgi:hypothetical protein
VAHTTFSGPIRVGNRDKGAGIVIASRTIDLVPTANANTDLSTYLPPCAQIVRASVLTGTAFTGATVTAQLGTTPGGSEIASATNVKSTGPVALTLNQAGINEAGDKQVYARIAQTTPTAVGFARLVIEYIPA